MKMDAMKRVRVSQIMAQLKLALIEDSARAQLESVQAAKKTLDLLEFQLIEQAAKEPKKVAP